MEDRPTRRFGLRGVMTLAVLPNEVFPYALPRHFSGQLGMQLGVALSFDDADDACLRASSRTMLYRLLVAAALALAAPSGAYSPGSDFADRWTARPAADQPNRVTTVVSNTRRSIRDRLPERWTVNTMQKDTKKDKKKHA